MSIRLRKSVFVVVKALLCGMLVFGTAVGVSAKTIELQWWYGFGGPGGEFIQSMALEYGKVNPDVKITATQVPGGEIAKKLMLAHATGEGLPDLVYISYSQKFQFASEGVMSVMPSEYAREVKTDYVPLAVSMATVNGKIYYQPTDIANLVVSYNKEMFAGAGIGSTPQNWNEFSEAAQKLTKRDAAGKLVQAGLHLWLERPFAHAAWVFLLNYLSNGGSLLNDTKSKFTLVNDQSIDSLQYAVNLSLTNPVDELGFSESGYVGIAQEKTAMFFSPCYYPLYLMSILDIGLDEIPAKFGAFEIPSGRIGRKTLLVGPQLIGVPAKSKHAKESWAAIDWLYAPERAIEWVHAKTSYGLSPRIDQQEASQWDEWIEVQAKSIDYTILNPDMWNWKQMEVTIANRVTAAMLGKEMIDDSLARAEEKCNELLLEELAR